MRIINVLNVFFYFNVDGVIYCDDFKLKIVVVYFFCVGLFIVDFLRILFLFFCVFCDRRELYWWKFFDLVKVYIYLLWKIILLINVLLLFFYKSGVI